MKKILMQFLIILLISVAVYAQKDTVYVQGFYETGGQYGTLNDAIEAAVAAGTINNTVFKLTPYDQYILTRSIFMDHGQNLEIVAPKPLRTGDPQAIQNSAPPQILWTDEDIDREYMIQTYGDLIMKNIWFRFSDVFGAKFTTSIVFEDQEPADEPEIARFDGCLLDYAMIGTESAGTITVKSDHFDGEFLNCFWRNNSDNHFRYYGRAISFPWQSSGWHYDRLFFENCTFTNLSRVVMMEGNEYASNVHLNHCTVVNTVEWVIQSGWLENVSVTNSIFVNPNMYGYRVYDLLDEGQDYDDWEDGLTDPPGGGLIDQITEVDSFGFEVDFTDADRKFYLANNVYMHRDYLVDWYVNAPWAQEKVRQRQPEETYHPSPMVGGSVIDMVDSVDSEGNKAFPKINIDWETIYDENPDFIVEPTKVDTMLLFVEQKWSDNGDYNWSFMPEAGLNQEWLLPENLAYNNETYKTAAMGGFPLGDLNWFPEQMSAWEAQRDTEWDLINSWLDGVVDVKEISSAVPTDYELSQNYPNPFNPTTKIHFAIPVKGHVSLKVYNNLGQEVATLFNGIQNAGNYEATFNASRLSSGVYFYELKTNDFTTTKKLMLLK